MQKKKIQLLVGSNRPTRIGLNVAEWIAENANKEDGVEIEIIDLAKVNLPLLDEPKKPSEDQYTKDHTKAWSETISSGDGYIWLTPEYNAGYTAIIKNAVDYLYKEWADKPVLVISYGVGGGQTANSQLTAVAERLKTRIVNPTLEIAITDDKRHEDYSLKNIKEDFKQYEAGLKASIDSLRSMI